MRPLLSYKCLTHARRVTVILHSHALWVLPHHSTSMSTEVALGRSGMLSSDANLLTALHLPCPRALT
eukprot:2830172-Amphidinium_carterae.1